MLRFLRNTLHPERYHGRTGRQPTPFFEGWYFKVVDRTGQNRFAFIPGIFWNNRPHAFIQVLDGSKGEAHYHEYPVEAFSTPEDRFDLRLGESRFSTKSFTLAIDKPEQRITGSLQLSGNIPWPVRMTSPGIMGWYAWVPYMECYHGVVSLDHALDGSLTVDGREIDFSGGRGYIEKDWGRSFPEAWIWFQTNHFTTPRTSLTGSIAIIPWGRTSFPGFIIGLWHDGRLFRFATYTGAKTERLVVTENTVDWQVSDKAFQLSMLVIQGPGRQFGLLKGPDIAEMGKRVAETLSAMVEVTLTDKRSGRVLLAETGHYAGLEVHRVDERLLKMVAAGK